MRRNTALSSFNEGITFGHNTESGGWERVWDKIYLSALWFGAKADGSQDETPYVAAMLTYAETNNIAKMLFPWGLTGVYKFTSPLIDQRLPASGLTFEGVGRHAEINVANGVRIRYTGTSTWVDVRTPNGLEAVGRWTWRHLVFETTTNAGSLFNFNDPAAEMTDDTTTPYYIHQVRFEHCHFRGPGVTAVATGSNQTVTSTAVRGNGTFAMMVDDTCVFWGFKRAIELKGADDCRIGGRYTGNCRHITLTRSGATFGNDTRLRPAHLGALITDGVETPRHLSLSAHGTTVDQAFIEGGAQPAIYLNGLANVLYRPKFSAVDFGAPNNVVLHVGPNAAENVIIAPQHTAPEATSTFDSPAYWEWDGIEQFYAVTVLYPSKRMEQGSFKPHPRLRVHSEYNLYEDILRSPGVGPTGTYSRVGLLTAHNLERGRALSGFSYITDVVADTNAPGGYAIRLGTDNRSALRKMVVGTHVNNGQTIRTTIRYKNVSSPTNGDSAHYAVERNFVGMANAGLAVSTSYTTASFTYTLSGYAVGDILTAGVYNAGNQSVDVASVLVEVMDPSGVAVETVQSLSNNSTISLGTSGASVLPVSETANITGIIVAAGLYDGQLINIVNRNAFTLSFAAAGTSRVADGATTTIAANRQVQLVWDANYGGADTGRWVKSG